MRTITTRLGAFTALALALTLIIAACGGGSTPAQTAADHVTVSATELMNLQGNAAIKDWIERESAWVHVQSDQPTLREYAATITLAKTSTLMMTPSTNLGDNVVYIISAARTIPGVKLP